MTVFRRVTLPLIWPALAAGIVLTWARAPGEFGASAEPVARHKGVRLTGAAVRGMPVFVDSAEMGRALRNLVTNAIRHTPSDGGVDVLAEVQSGMACVSGPDPRHGCGETGLPLFGALGQMG